MGRAGPGNFTLGKRPVDEATRIELHRTVEELITGKDECASLEISASSSESMIHMCVWWFVY